jgi:U3 small nucleolar RNA-associated protein 10
MIKEIKKINSLKELIKQILMNYENIKIDSYFLQSFLSKYKEIDFVIEYLFPFIHNYKSSYSKYKLFSIFEYVTNKNILFQSKTLINDYIKIMNKKDMKEYEKTFSILLFKQFNVNLISSINEKEEIFELLLYMIKSLNITIEISGQKFSPLKEIFNYVNENFFEKLEKKKKNKLFKELFTILFNGSEDIDIAIRIKELFKNVNIESEAILMNFNNLKIENNIFEDEEKIETLNMILEIIQNMEHISEIENLIQPFNQMIQKILKLKLNNQTFYLLNNIIYTLNFIIVEIVQNYEENSEKKKIINKLDLNLISNLLGNDNIVSNKNEKNMITENCLLIILNCLRFKNQETTKYNSLILNSISHLIKNFSNFNMNNNQNLCQSMKKILKIIIPNLIEEDLNIIPYIKIFTESFSIIPREIRKELFKILIDEISTNELYSVTLLLIINREDINEKLEFLHDLMLDFSISKQLKCIFELIKSIRIINNEIKKTSLIHNELSNDELFQKLIIKFVNDHLETTTFLKNLIKYEKIKSEKSQNFLESIGKSLILFICFINEKNINIEKLSFITYSKVQQLLSIETFIKTIKKLLINDESHIVLKASIILNQKLMDPTYENIVDLQKNQNLFVEILPFIINLIKQESNETENKKQMKNETNEKEKKKKNENENNKSYIKQELLISIENFYKIFSNFENKYEKSIIDLITNNLKDNSIYIASSAALCLSTIVSKIGVNSLGYLNSIFKKLFDAFNDILKLEVEDEKDIKKDLGVYSFLQSFHIIVRNNIKFLSPYLKQLINLLLRNELMETQNKQIQDVNTKILILLSTEIEPRIILTPIFELFSSTILNGDKSVIKLFECIELIILNFNSKMIEKNYEIIFDYFKKVFDIRRLHGDKISDINKIEKQIIKTFNSFVIKMNEKLFKNIFMDFIDWSNEINLNESFENVYFNQNVHRLIIFYKIIFHLSNNLKSIFVPFWGYFIENSLNILNSLFINDISGNFYFFKYFLNKKVKFFINKN